MKWLAALIVQVCSRRDPARRAAEIQEWADRIDRAEQAERERRVRYGL
ncbi:hypothetical protein SEA_TWONLO_16 [Gordonia phage Twonlo]|uniref:Uncharacterized protein n=1 Tax=Gordonia phage Tiamoceli TaxID=2510508 RepID=A0A411CSC9_9CAUD|nr:hypothetical protein J1598_gp19 [Gordonia phage Tiamoceli]QAY16763.1 hypothetical protein SEA_TIAMOCELI_19 [Gordonia phage Tiamoceli]QDF19601.1 hypothetical protein SEA_ROADKILL_16 [Gordonia Terrae phage RoadKill]QOI66762.1 hypothetical protein SEA_TWONLO_16 [Gordonia phage Twonlo]